MYKKRFIIYFVLNLFLAVPSALSAVPLPSQLSDPEHEALRDFVQWMRKKNYAENVISKWVEDYLDPKFHYIMKNELSKFGNPSIRFDPPITIKYIELVPTDQEATSIQFDEENLKERFKSTFGTTIQLEHYIHYVPFEEKFGEFSTGYVFNYKKVDGQWVEEKTEIAVLNKTKYYQWVEDNLYTLYVDDKSFFPSNRHIVRNAIKSYKNKLVADSTANAQLLTLVGNEDPSGMFDDDTFKGHAHEWAHAWGHEHHYGGAETDFKSYGTFGTLSVVCDKASSKLAQYGSIIDPLQAYLLEPVAGFEFPGQVTGEVYSDYLKTLEYCEFPYTPDPDPALKVSAAIKKISLTSQVTINNVGNIPLVFVPVQTKVSCFIKDKLAKRPLVDKKIINWISISEKINFNLKFPAHFVAQCETIKAEVKVKNKNIKSI